MAHIGLMVYSQTGNTLSVARLLQEQLQQQGHTVTLEQVQAGEPVNGRVQLTAMPPVDEYDSLVLASPVQAFSLAQAMQVYLDQLPALKDKTVAFLITKQLPFNWTGGNRAIRQMKRACLAKGATLSGEAIVHWRQKQREQETREAVERLSAVF